jgi:hypothetical protein
MPLVALYLGAQAVLVAAWWIVLWLEPSSRAPFLPTGWPDSALFAFVVPDLVVIVCGSAMAAFGVRDNRAWTRPVLLVLFGAVFYATMWCFGCVVTTGEGWLSVAMMVARLAGTGWALSASRS